MQKIKSKNKMYKPTCHLHIPRHDMKSREVMQVQVISIEATCLPARGWRGDRINFSSANKLLADGEEFNVLIDSAMYKH